MSDVLHPLESEVTLVTSFQDADPMGVIYHGNYFRFFVRSTPRADGKN